MKTVVIAFALLWLARFACAEPHVYTIDRAASRVEFIFLLGGKPVTGNLPLEQAYVVLDLDTIANSKVSIVLGMAKITAGSLIATAAVRSQKVLNTNVYPQAQFVSRLVRRSTMGVVMEGDLTLRGVTRRVEMTVRIFGDEDNRKARMSVLVNGILSRGEFGAKGYPGLVADQIELRIGIELAR